MKKRLAFLLALSMTVSLAACGSSSNSGSGSASAEEGSETVVETTAEAGSYTYHTTISSINTWSPTDWELSSEDTIISLTMSELWAFVMADNDAQYEIIPELATEMPVDVTDEYAGNETYGVPEDGVGYAWKVTIRQDAVWEDGTPITVDDFEYSLQQFLNPEMKNYRASNYYSGTGAIANAQDYYNSGSMVYNSLGDEEIAVADLVLNADGQYETADGVAVYVNWGGVNDWLGGYALSDYWGYGYTLDEYADAFDEAANADGQVPATEDMLANITAAITAEDWGEDEESVPYYLTYEAGKGEETPWENVGFVKNDDYSFTIILDHSSTEFYFIYAFSAYNLLNEEKYEAAKQDAGGIIKSAYGTSVENYSSYGPYKVTEYQEGKQLTLEKNENWYGYTDGQHEGCYQTTGFDFQQIDEHTTQLNLFLQGKLDDVSLTSEDVDDYGTSDYVYYAPETYTAAFAFNTDFEMLASRETDGINKTILTYKDFRKAFSLALNRTDYCNSCTAGYDPTYGLLNDEYVYDPESMAAYRDSEEAQQVLCDVYDVDSIDDVTGYDPEEASELLQAAYDQCLADGNIDEDDVVTIEYHIYGSDALYQKQVDYVQDAMDAVAEGTSLEGRIKFELVEDQDFYTTMTNGQDDMIREAWGGSQFDPYNLMEVYTTEDYITEFGFDPYVDLTINVEGEDITMTINDWYTELCAGEYVSADSEVRNTILAGIEGALLENYHVIPVASYTDATLYSQRVVWPAEEYINAFVGYGGYRELTYTMDDAEWEAYCAEQNNQLTY